MRAPAIRNAVLILTAFLDRFPISIISAKYYESEDAIRQFLYTKGYDLDKSGAPAACCAWCSTPLKRRNERFCNRECQSEYRRDAGVREDAGTLKRCKYCDAPLPDKRDYCCPEHRKAHDNKQWLELLKRVRRMHGHLSEGEIAREIGVDLRTVRGAIAAIVAEKKVVLGRDGVPVSTVGECGLRPVSHSKAARQKKLNGPSPHSQR